MRAELVEAIVRGDRLIWSALATLWLCALVFTLRRRRGEPPRHSRVFFLLGLASTVALSGTVVAAALAIPRLAWKDASDAVLVAASGETWRRVRGPYVAVFVDGAPDLAVPVVDKDGRWVLYGMLTARALAEFPPAPEGSPEAGASRLCGVDNDHCRPWPAAWPDPARAAVFTDIVWSKEGATGALAYDVESRLYLRDVAGVAGSTGRALELVGRIANDPPRDGANALFVIRRIASGRFEAARLVGIAGSPPRFRLERSHASLVHAPRVLHYFATPLLFACSLSLPLGLLAYLLAPAALAARLRRRAAVRRELSRALVLVPLNDAESAAASKSFVHDAACLATVADDADLGDALLARGTLVCATLGAPAGRPVSSRAWFELPAGAGSIVGAQASAEGLATRHDERGATRSVGILVPADSAPFGRTARAWLKPYVHALALLAIGVGVAAPAVVAVVALVTSR
jgi:hypothetical protein